MRGVSGDEQALKVEDMVAGGLYDCPHAPTGVSLSGFEDREYLNRLEGVCEDL